MFSHLIEKGKEKIELIKKRDRRYLGLGPKQTGFSEPLAHLQHPGPMLRPNSDCGVAAIAVCARPVRVDGAGDSYQIKNEPNVDIELSNVRSYLKQKRFL